MSIITVDIGVYIGRDTSVSHVLRELGTHSCVVVQTESDRFSVFLEASSHELINVFDHAEGFMRVRRGEQDSQLQIVVFTGEGAGDAALDKIKALFEKGTLIFDKEL